MPGEKTAAKIDDLRRLLDEMLAETGGPLTADERRAAARHFEPRPELPPRRARRPRDPAD